MVEEVINGISVQLNKTFGDGFEIYTQNVEQGLTEPCFFIKALPIGNKPLLGKRKQRSYPFNISYFSKDGNENLMSVGEKMLDSLEYITLLSGDMLRGASMEYQIIDDILQFSVTYTVFINDLSRAESMDSAQLTIGTKGDSNGD